MLPRQSIFEHGMEQNPHSSVHSSKLECISSNSTIIYKQRDLQGHKHMSDLVKLKIIFKYV